MAFTMSRELILYCDESDISGKYYSNFYGGALVESRHLQEVHERLTRKKLALNLNAELKWQKISEAYAEKYISFSDEIFNLAEQGKLKLRLMCTHSYLGPLNLTPVQRENSFFLLYYEFIKHGFGLTYCGVDGHPTRLRIYFDMLPDSTEKCRAFKDHVLGLDKFTGFRRATLKIDGEQIAEVDSKDHVIMQALDVVLGAMQFRLNDKHLEKPEGSSARGKRTIAKERVFRHISARVRQLYPAFNIGISTGIDGDARNVWRHAYRHWIFRPAEFGVRPQYFEK